MEGKRKGVKKGGRNEEMEKVKTKKKEEKKE